MDRHDNNFQQDSKWFVGKMLYTSFKLDNFSFDTFSSIRHLQYALSVIYEFSIWCVLTCYVRRVYMHDKIKYYKY